MQVDNVVANDLLIAVRKGERIADFMDSVSGVDNYKLSDHSRQGHIRSMFAKELIAEQFLLDFDDIISIFWKGVFEQLDKAKLWGETVEIRAPGVEREFRPTSNNPIHFLRYHGRMSVRNHITALYRKNLEQGCPVCGHRTSIKNNKECPKCHKMMVTLYRYVEEDESIPDVDEYAKLDSFDISIKIKSLIQEFAETVLGKGTRAYQVMEILTNPAASRDMCGSCKLCGMDTFDIDVCTNYNANIGRWLGVNKTMIANKVRSIRKRFPEWLRANHSDEAEYLLHIIPKRHGGLG
jgi:hypothetical protein